MFESIQYTAHHQQFHITLYMQQLAAGPREVQQLVAVQQLHIQRYVKLLMMSGVLYTFETCRVQIVE